MVLKPLISGFFVKIVTGFDDTITQIPIVGAVTHTKRGRIAFSLGILLAIITAILLSFSFASVIREIPYYKYIAVALILLLAVFVYFDILVHKPREKAKQKLKKIKHISIKRFVKLTIIGFLAAFATVIDDSIAYMPLLAESFITAPYVALGILLATILQIIVIIYFSRKVAKIKYKKEITSLGLVLIAILVLFNVL